MLFGYLCRCWPSPKRLHFFVKYLLAVAAAGRFLLLVGYIVAVGSGRRCVSFYTMFFAISDVGRSFCSLATVSVWAVARPFLAYLWISACYPWCGSLFCSLATLSVLAVVDAVIASLRATSGYLWCMSLVVLAGRLVGVGGIRAAFIISSNFFLLSLVRVARFARRLLPAPTE